MGSDVSAKLRERLQGHRRRLSREFYSPVEDRKEDSPAPVPALTGHAVPSMTVEAPEDLGMTVLDVRLSSVNSLSLDPL